MKYFSLPIPHHYVFTMENSRVALLAYRNGLGSRDAVYKAVCLDIVEEVGSTRASVWHFTESADTLVCAALYDSRNETFDSGTVLSDQDFGAYFDAILQEGIINAADAANHPATSCFNAFYFIPNDIRSLFDHLITVGNRPTAVLCCEHCGDIKHWSDQDARYLTKMAGLLTVSIRLQPLKE